MTGQTPQPRRGLAGALDRFIGPGATRAEIALQFGVAAAAAVLAPLYAASIDPGWSPLRYGLAAFIAFDVAGGVMTNAMPSARRWTHRAGQGFARHMGFIALHAAHLAVVWWFFMREPLWLALSALYLIAAAAVVLATAKRLQRAVALALYAGALLLSLYVLRAPAGLEWFLPLFYLKLLVSYLPADPR